MHPQKALTIVTAHSQTIRFRFGEQLRQIKKDRLEEDLGGCFVLCHEMPLKDGAYWSGTLERKSLFWLDSAACFTVLCNETSGTSPQIDELACPMFVPPE